MTKGRTLREVARDMLVLLAYVPSVMLSVLHMRGTWRVVAVTFVTLAAFMTVDAIHGKLGRPATPSAVTRCLASNALFIAVFGTCIAFGFGLI